MLYTWNRAAMGTVILVLVVSQPPVSAQPTTRNSGILQVPTPGTDLALRTMATQNGDATAINDAVWQRSIASHVTLINRRALLAKVVNNANNGIRQSPWYSRFKTPDEAIDWLQANFHVAQIPNSALIEVWLGGDVDSMEAKTIVEEVVNQYLDDCRRAQTEKLTEMINALQRMRSQWSARITQLRNQKLSDTRALTLDGGDGLAGRAGQKEQELMQLTVDRLKAASAASRARTALEAAQKAVQQGDTPPQVEAMIDNNLLVSQLRAQLVNLEIQESAIRGPQPQTQPSQNISDLRNATSTRLGVLVGQERARNIENYIASLKSQVEGTTHDLDEIDKLIEKNRLDLADMAARSAQSAAARDELAGLQEQMRQVDQRLAILQTTLQQMDISEIRWASHPDTGGRR